MNLNVFLLFFLIIRTVTNTAVY